MNIKTVRRKVEEVALQSWEGAVGSSEQKGTSQQSGGEEADFLLLLSLRSCCPACNNCPAVHKLSSQPCAASGRETSGHVRRLGGEQTPRPGGQPAPPLRPRAAVCTDRRVLPGQTDNGWAQRLSGLMYKQLLVFVCFAFHLSWNEQAQLSGDFC